MEALFLIGRVIFGGFFLFMGTMHFKNLKEMTAYASSKGTPFPKLAVIVSGLMIVLGGLGVITGMYLDISLILLAVFLFFVTFKMHRFWKETDPNVKKSEMINFLKNMALFGAVILLFMTFFKIAS